MVAVCIRLVWKIDAIISQMWRSPTLKGLTIPAKNTFYRLLAVDMEGKLHSFNIFFSYYNVLTNYNNALWHYKNGEYYENELLLKEIIPRIVKKRENRMLNV